MRRPNPQRPDDLFKLTVVIDLEGIRDVHLHAKKEKGQKAGELLYDVVRGRLERLDRVIRKWGVKG